MFCKLWVGKPDLSGSRSFRRFQPERIAPLCQMSWHSAKWHHDCERTLINLRRGSFVLIVVGVLYDDQEMSGFENTSCL